MAKMRAQGMSLDTGIDLANKQADADEANLLAVEQIVRQSAQSGTGDSIIPPFVIAIIQRPDPAKTSLAQR
jgi:hypothetical protein